MSAAGDYERRNAGVLCLAADEETKAIFQQFRQHQPDLVGFGWRAGARRNRISVVADPVGPGDLGRMYAISPGKTGLNIRAVDHQTARRRPNGGGWGRREADRRRLVRVVSRRPP